MVMKIAADRGCGRHKINTEYGVLESREKALTVESAKRRPFTTEEIEEIGPPDNRGHGVINRRVSSGELRVPTL